MPYRMQFFHQCSQMRNSRKRADSPIQYKKQTETGKRKANDRSQ